MRQQQIDKRLLKANAKRVSHDFKQGDKVLKRRIRTPGQKLLSPFYPETYRIVQVHTNGTVTLQIMPNVLERTNIRRIVPFREPPNPNG